MITLPLGQGVPLRLQRVDVRTLDTDGGLVMIGVLVGPTEEIDEGAGDPERLLTNPFSVEVANVYLALHEVLVQKIVGQAKDSGELERLARQENDDLRIEGATAELRPNEVRIIIDGRLKDACGPPGFTFKDVGFRATRTYRYAVFGGEIVVTEEEDINLDNTDTAVCVLLGALEALVAGALFTVFGGLADIIAQIVRYIRLSPGGGSDDPIRLNAVFATSLPVPGTELLPRAETLQSLVEDDQILANGVITLRNDNVNTYLYAAFLERSGTFGEVRTPLANARVRLVDQDVPAPAGDDARIPVSETEVVFSGPKRRVTVTTSFEPPSSDQLLATERTSSEGVARFVLRPNQIRTTAGTVVTTTVTDLLDRRPPVPPEVTTQRTPLREQRPDIYFEVTLSNGRVVDTTTLASGLVVNLASRRVGNADSPLTFVVGRAGQVVAGP